MAEVSAVFVGMDAAKSKHAVAIAEPGRNGEVRYIGEIEASPEAVQKLLYSAHVRIRKSLGEMTRKLSDTASQ